MHWTFKNNIFCTWPWIMTLAIRCCAWNIISIMIKLVPSNLKFDWQTIELWCRQNYERQTDNLNKIKDHWTRRYDSRADLKIHWNRRWQNKMPNIIGPLQHSCQLFWIAGFNCIVIYLYSYAQDPNVYFCTW